MYIYECVRDTLTRTLRGGDRQWKKALHISWNAIWWVVKWDFASALHRWSHCWPDLLDLTLYFHVQVCSFFCWMGSFHFYPFCSMVCILYFLLSSLQSHNIFFVIFIQIITCRDSPATGGNQNVFTFGCVVGLAWSILVGDLLSYK